MINKAIHTLAPLSEEDAGEIASSGVFWQSVPTGDSVRKVGETASISGVWLFLYIRVNKQKIKHNTSPAQWQIYIYIELPLGRERVFSPGIYLVTGWLECKPLLLSPARILWMNQDCTIEGRGWRTQTHRPTYSEKRSITVTFSRRQRQNANSSRK